MEDQVSSSAHDHPGLGPARLVEVADRVLRISSAGWVEVNLA